MLLRPEHLPMWALAAAFGILLLRLKAALPRQQALPGDLRARLVAEGPVG